MRKKRCFLAYSTPVFVWHCSFPLCSMLTNRPPPRRGVRRTWNGGDPAPPPPGARMTNSQSIPRMLGAGIGKPDGVRFSSRLDAVAERPSLRGSPGALEKPDQETRRKGRAKHAPCQQAAFDLLNFQGFRGSAVCSGANLARSLADPRRQINTVFAVLDRGECKVERLKGLKGLKRVTRLKRVKG